MTRPLAVLRPEPGNTATAARIAALGLRALRLPLFAARAVRWSPPDPDRYDALLVTSANAIRLGGEGLQRLRGLPVHAVGAATADAARAAGFTIASIGSGGVDSLRAGLGNLRLLHLAGRDHRATDAETIVVYASEPLSPDLSDLAGAVALVHSPRAGERLAALVRERGHIRIAAISPAALAAAGEGWAANTVAPTPDDAALIAAGARLAD